MWDLFYHFLMHVANSPVVGDASYGSGTRLFWTEQLRLLDQGVRDGRIHDNSLAFVSWYQANWGEFLVGESELWPDVLVYSPRQQIQRHSNTKRS